MTVQKSAQVSKPVELLTGHEAIMKGIAGIVAKGKAYDNHVQLVALSAISVVGATGNIFYVNEMYKALSKGTRHIAMSAWLKEFGGVEANILGKDKAQKPWVYLSKEAVDVKAAAAMPWFSFKPSPGPDVAYDILEGLQRVLKAASGAKAGTVHSELLEGVKALIESAGTDDAHDESDEGYEVAGAMPEAVEA